MRPCGRAAELCGHSAGGLSLSWPAARGPGCGTDVHILISEGRPFYTPPPDANQTQDEGTLPSPPSFPSLPPPPPSFFPSHINGLEFSASVTEGPRGVQDAGMPPVRLLPDRSTFCRLTRDDQLEGNGPVKLPDLQAGWRGGRSEGRGRARGRARSCVGTGNGQVVGDLHGKSGEGRRMQEIKGGERGGGEGEVGEGDGRRPHTSALWQ